MCRLVIESALASCLWDRGCLFHCQSNSSFKKKIYILICKVWGGVSLIKRLCHNLFKCTMMMLTRQINSTKKWFPVNVLLMWHCGIVGNVYLAQLVFLFLLCVWWFVLLRRVFGSLLRSPTLCRSSMAGTAVRSAAALRGCGPMRSTLW